MQIIVKETNLKLNSTELKLLEDKMKSVIKFFPKIIEIRAEIEYDKGRSKGDSYRCEANVSIPGKLIRVEKYTTSWEKAVNKVKDHLKVVLAKEKGRKMDKRGK